MMYKDNIKQGTLDTLHNRVSSVCDCVLSLLDAGFVPNKNKATILNWSSLLIHAYEQYEVFSEEQKQRIDNLYNKIMNL